MPFDETLARRIRRRLARRRNVAEKRMFGCVVFLLNGNVLLGVWKDSLVVRVGRDEAEQALWEPHVGKFDITGRPMKGWVAVAPAGVADDDQLADWIRRAVSFVSTLPPKEE